MNKYFKFIIFALLSINVILIAGEIADWSYNASNTLNGFEITEFLINYQGGFVRRGLIGEILYHICTFFSIDPRYIIIPACIAAMSAYVSIIIILFRKQNLSLWILPTYYALCGGVCIRKDYMVMLLVLLIVYLLKRYSKNASSMGLFGITCVSILTFNIHESSFFIIFPLVAAYILFIKNKINIWERLFHVIIPILVFAIISICKGTQETASLICDSWANIEPYGEANLGDVPNSITALTWTIHGAADLHLNFNFASGPGWKHTAIILRPIVMIIILYLAVHVSLVHKRGHADFSNQVARLVNLAIFQFISLLPMFTILSCDFRRCCFYWLMSTFTSFMLLRNVELSFTGKDFLIKVTTPIIHVFTLRAPLQIVFILLLCISVPYQYNHAGDYLSPLLKTIRHAVAH